jgi:hypothetical protein
MSYEAFVSRITFRLIRPGLPLPRGSHTLVRCLRKANIFVDVLNTVLPEDDARLKRILQPLYRIPRLSTFPIAAIINRAVGELTPDEAFVNVGVWNGFTFLAGMLNNPEKLCIGIDDFSELGGPRRAFLRRFEALKGPRHRFVEMDYQEYFRRHHQDRIGVYVYDGHHAYRYQLEGLQLAEPFFSDDCLVLVDDTNWAEPRRATLDFVRGSPHRYETLLDARTAGNKHPTFWNGLMVLRRCA